MSLPGRAAAFFFHSPDPSSPRAVFRTSGGTVRVGPIWKVALNDCRGVFVNTEVYCLRGQRCQHYEHEE